MEEPQDQREPVTGALNDLRDYYEAAEPVEVWLADDPHQDYFEGYIVTIGSDFVLLARLFQRSWLNGFRAHRLTSIDEVLPADDAAFVQRAMRVRSQPTPPAIPFRADTLAQLLACVCDYYPVVIIDDDPVNENLSGIAGTVTEVSDDSVHIRPISDDGYWIEQVRAVPLRHIESVMFGSQYEETLFLMRDRPRGPNVS